MKGVKEQMAKVLLGDVVDHVKDKVDKDTTDLEFYVGGEHIDGDEITVRRRGRIEGSTIGPAFHMRFQQGDVLLMSRNPHLRKASMVDFDGICSDVSYVCRTKDNNVLLQSLLPFILQTPEFWQFAEENKKGGLPFFLNWKDFARFEFELLPIDRQQQISNLLWAMERVKNAYRELIAKTDDLVKSQFIEMFGDPVDNPMGWETRLLLTMGSCKNGMNFHSNDSGVEINCLGVGDFKDYDVIAGTGDLPTVSLNEMPTEDYLLKDGDIVFVRSNGNKTMVGRSVLVYPKDNPTTFSGFCIRYRHTDDSIMVPYLLRVLKTESMRKQMYGRGANIQNLNQKTLAALNIPVPPIEAQRQYIAFVEQSDKSKFAAQQTLKELTDAQKALMKKIFE